jgi:poly(beta-D-mannuronate) lyase
MPRGIAAFGLFLIVTGAAAACPAHPPVRDLDLPRFYADAAGTEVDPAARDAHAAAVAPLTAFVRAVTQEADRALTRPTGAERRTLARCPLDQLARWADGEALLGRMSQAQADYQRKWDLAGLALAYLKLKPFATPTQRSAIEPWLVRLGDAARAFFDAPGRKRNNHWYWLGLGLGAVGLAADTPRHWDMARGIMADAVRDIGADGLLPLELQRGPRALFYHVFALMPLIPLAELAASRGEDWYALADGALHRLVAVVHAGLRDPAPFVRATGVFQEVAANARAGWLQLYLARFPDRLAPPHPAVAMGHRWLGGSVLTLQQALRAR